MGGPQGPHEPSWGVFGPFWGPRGPMRARGPPPDPHGDPQRLRGHFPTTSDFGLRAAPLRCGQNPSKQASPRGLDPSRSIRNAFLLRVGGLNPSESLLEIHFMTFLALGCFRNCGQGSEKEGWGLRKRAGVGEGGQGSEKEDTGRRRRTAVGEGGQGSEKEGWPNVFVWPWAWPGRPKVAI